MQINGARNCHPECGNPNPKVHAWYVLPDKWILAMKYRETMIHPTDPKTLKQKESPGKDD